MATDINDSSYDAQKESMSLFMLNFSEKGTNTRKYMDQLQEIKHRKSESLNIYMDDVEEFEQHVPATGQDAYRAFVAGIQSNTLRYTKLFAEVADDHLANITATMDVPMDVFDILLEQRRAIEAQRATAGDADMPGTLPALPPSLMRRYQVYIHPARTQEMVPLRKICAQHVGQLVRVRGIVTQITDVKPLATVVSYIDEDTNREVFQEVYGRSFMPEHKGSKDSVTGAKKYKRDPMMNTRGSKFVKFQEARIQEMADEVPEGCTPRTMSIHIKGSITRAAKAGDVVEVAGIFLPEPLVGFKAMRAGLLASTYLEVMMVTQTKPKYSDIASDEGLRSLLARIRDDGNVYDRLARSIAPEIFGHEDVKKSLLLQLVGGVTKDFQGEGMKLRGDIHVCLMGDPGVAKSQLLKYISRLAPRAVYTTGKGSSGVGLTAAVLRNAVTKELVLEGGALVLADKGICCIDEFDKMEEGDRTSIHEVMEQQTVSIAKAGITTTLNTRTTILAAANPAWGRWDKRRTIEENVNMPHALLSRFDLMWLILDKPDEELDTRLAEHVLAVHQAAAGKAADEQDDDMGAPSTSAAGQAGDENGELISQQDLRKYIAFAKTFEPSIPVELTDNIKQQYIGLRGNQADKAGAGARYTTARTLMSILRLSQSVAKLRFDDRVTMSDVDEALRLMKVSQISIASDLEARERADPISEMYLAIMAAAQRAHKSELSFDEVAKAVGSKYERADVLRCLQEYEAINVLTLHREGNSVASVIINDLEFAGDDDM